MTYRYSPRCFSLVLVALFSFFAVSLAHAETVHPGAGGEPLSWGVKDFLILLGSLSLLLYGMQRMSEGLQHAAGARLRHIMGSVTSNPVKAVLAGLGVTVLVQSSSVTTVMTVSFVNAGILTLKQAAGVIMGAGIGTTLTGWIVAAFGFKVAIAPYTLILFALGFPLLFFRSSKVKGWGKAILGFSLLFMGLSFLSNALPEVRPDSPIVLFFLKLSEVPYFGILVSVLFGALLTIIIQSSSATLALTMALMVGGVIPFTVGAAMVLGENVGTTITAELAATVGNVHAKRTARFHLMFNLLGVGWALALFPWFMDAVVALTGLVVGGDPLVDPRRYGTTGLAVLHTTFNVTNALIFIGFIPKLIRLVEWMVPARDESDEQYHLEFLSFQGDIAPELSILEVKKELARFGELTSRMSEFTRTLMTTDSRKTKRELLKRIAKYEEITDRVEVEVAEYLNRVSSANASTELAIRFYGMNRVASNLERIGDIFYQVSKMLEKKEEEDIEFSDSQEKRLLELFSLIDEAFSVMRENQEKNFADVSITKANEIEERINQKRDEIRHEYYANVRENRSKSLAGDLLYNKIYNSLERIGDHIINVTEGVLGKV